MDGMAAFPVGGLDFPEVRHQHRPDLKSTLVEDRWVKGVHEVRPPCSVCGEPMDWRQAT